MNVSQVNSNTPLVQHDTLNQNAPVTPEHAAAFEASVYSPTGSTADDKNPSEQNSDAFIPADSWDAFYKGFNHSIFERTRRELAYYDQKRKEIDYGNKT